MSEELKMSSKGQIVIPKEIREKLHIKTGQKFRVVELEGTIMIIPIPKDPIRAMRGMSKGAPESVKSIRELRKEWD